MPKISSGRVFKLVLIEVSPHERLSCDSWVRHICLFSMARTKRTGRNSETGEMAQLRADSDEDKAPRAGF